MIIFKSARNKNIKYGKLIKLKCEMEKRWLFWVKVKQSLLT